MTLVMLAVVSEHQGREEVCVNERITVSLHSSLFAILSAWDPNIWRWGRAIDVDTSCFSVLFSSICNTLVYLLDGTVMPFHPIIHFDKFMVKLLGFQKCDAVMLALKSPLNWDLNTIIILVHEILTLVAWGVT